MNPKEKGEKGQRIVIGELAKCDLSVAIPLSDNLPWDLVVISSNGSLLKAQVKTSSESVNNGSVVFGLYSNNWYSGSTKKYDENDCDIMLLCDYENVYLLTPDEFTGRKCFTIRKEASKNGQSKNVNLAEKYLLANRIPDIRG